MKKTVIIIAGLIVAAMLGAIGYSSVKTEKVFTSQTEKMQELYGSRLGISLDAYQRGFFQSRSKTTLLLGKSKPLHMLHRVTHLPWGSKVVTTVDQQAYTPEDLAAIRAWLPLEQLKMVCHFGLMGSSDMKMELPAIAMEQDGGKISLTGMGLTGGLNAAMDRGEFDLKIENLQLKFPDGKGCSIAGLRYSGTYRDEGGLPLGEGALQLDAIQAMHGEIVTHSLKKLICRFNSTLTDQTLNEYVDITFENMAASDVSCSNGQLKFDITGIDADSFRAIRDVYRVSSANALRAGDVDPFMMQLQVMAKSMELLQKGMYLKLEILKADFSNGMINAEGFVDLKKRADGGNSSFDLKSIEAQVTAHFDQGAFAEGYRLTSALRGNRGSAEDLSRQAEMLSRSLLTQGVLVQGGDGGLMAEVSFADGKVSLNGKPMAR